MIQKNVNKLVDKIFHGNIIFRLYPRFRTITSFVRDESRPYNCSLKTIIICVNIFYYLCKVKFVIQHYYAW